MDSSLTLMHIIRDLLSVRGSYQIHICSTSLVNMLSTVQH